MSAAAEKAALRTRMRGRLAALAAADRRERSLRLLDRLTALPAWTAARRVLLFAPLPGEPDLDLLWAGKQLAGKTTVYPRVEGEALGLYAASGLSELRPARWGLREPPAAPARRVEVSTLDLVLAPGLAFTAAGRRLGRGGGFYDRLLAGTSAARKIGVAFAFQVLPSLPQESHDAGVDALVTDANEAGPFFE